MAPRISVQTTGPRQWAVVAEDREEANEVRNRFSRRGLSCGPISQEIGGFVFLANVEKASSSRQETESAVLG